jgi:hypothetical protein
MSRFFTGKYLKQDTEVSHFPEGLKRFLGGPDGFKRYVAWKTSTRDTIDVHAQFKLLSLAERLKQTPTHQVRRLSYATASAPKAFNRLFACPPRKTQPRLLPAKTGLLAEDFEAGRFWPRPALQQQLATLVKDNQIALVTGPRASGKTSLVRYCAFEHYDNVYALQCFNDTGFPLDHATHDILFTPGVFIIDNVHRAPVSVQRLLNAVQQNMPDTTRLILVALPHLPDLQDQDLPDISTLPSLCIPPLKPGEDAAFLYFLLSYGGASCTGVPLDLSLYKATSGDMWLLSYAASALGDESSYATIVDAVRAGVKKDIRSIANSLTTYGFHRTDTRRALTGISLLCRSENTVEAQVATTALNVPVAILDRLIERGELIAADGDMVIRVGMPHASLSAAYAAYADMNGLPGKAEMIAKYARAGGTDWLELADPKVIKDVLAHLDHAGELPECLEATGHDVPAIFDKLADLDNPGWFRYVLPWLRECEHLYEDPALLDRVVTRLLRHHIPACELLDHIDWPRYSREHYYSWSAFACLYRSLKADSPELRRQLLAAAQHSDLPEASVDERATVSEIVQGIRQDGMHAECSDILGLMGEWHRDILDTCKDHGGNMMKGVGCEMFTAAAERIAIIDSSRCPQAEEWMIDNPFWHDWVVTLAESSGHSGVASHFLCFFWRYYPVFSGMISEFIRSDPTICEIQHGCSPGFADCVEQVVLADPVKARRLAAVAHLDQWHSLKSIHYKRESLWAMLRICPYCSHHEEWVSQEFGTAFLQDILPLPDDSSHVRGLHNAMSLIPGSVSEWARSFSPHKWAQPGLTIETLGLRMKLLLDVDSHLFEEVVAYLIEEAEPTSYCRSGLIADYEGMRTLALTVPRFAHRLWKNYGGIRKHLGPSGQWHRMAIEMFLGSDWGSGQQSEAQSLLSISGLRDPGLFVREPLPIRSTFTGAGLLSELIEARPHQGVEVATEMDVGELSLLAGRLVLPHLMAEFVQRLARFLPDIAKAVAERLVEETALPEDWQVRYPAPDTDDTPPG